MNKLFSIAIFATLLSHSSASAQDRQEQISQVWNALGAQVQKEGHWSAKAAHHFFSNPEVITWMDRIRMSENAEEREQLQKELEAYTFLNYWDMFGLPERLEDIRYDKIKKEQRPWMDGFQVTWQPSDMGDAGAGVLKIRLRHKHYTFSQCMIIFGSDSNPSIYCFGEIVGAGGEFRFVPRFDGAGKMSPEGSMFSFTSNQTKNSPAQIKRWATMGIEPTWELKEPSLHELLQ